MTKKVLLLLSALMLGLLSCNRAENPYQSADQDITPAAEALYNKLISLKEKGIMIGHQDALVYGHSWRNGGEPDIKAVTGYYPAVFGWELGDIELGKSYTLDSVTTDEIINGIKWVHKNGGINTISWHANNPLTAGNSWDTSSKEVVSSILPGGVKHKEYKRMLDNMANFFHQLTDDNGELIPVIFRPFHEHTGSWFWWGYDLCNTSDYKKLWRFTVSYLKGRDLHNILYTYSSASKISSREEYLERYPGDDIIDIIGFDEYQGGIEGKEGYINSVKNGMDIIVPIAEERKKIVILAETGMGGLPDAKWWTKTLWQAVKDYPISYVLFWRNAHDQPEHFFAPYPGQKSADDFKTLSKNEHSLFLNDIQ
ncbi:MAG: glycosyl hydrolase [Prolixibacteraceae bacterium]|jgi:mannan endo-1,4-beta-mannosidase|nr:glycosyl hydrolase [Prolixibacteraceae bacterium]